MIKFHHTALTVKNLEVSRKFYETVFGLKLKNRWERPELNLIGINLEDTNGNIIELIEPKVTLGIENDLSNLNKIGLKHICFSVDNAEEVFNKGLQNGSKVIWPIKNGVSVKKIGFVSDPDGIPVEIIEL